MRGLSPGNSRRVRVPPTAAYGPIQDSLIIAIARERIADAEALAVGQRVGLSNGLSARVLSIDADEVQLDANHELAGKALTFDIELLGFAEMVLEPPADGLQRAVFGLGCFWGSYEFLDHFVKHGTV